MGKPYTPRTPPPLPWEETSHYPGYQVHGNPGGTWIPVGSSNVEAIRWVEGADYPLQVRFLAKGRQPASEYEYKVTQDVYDNMFSSSSVGRFVHFVFRQFPYRKIA